MADKESKEFEKLKKRVDILESMVLDLIKHDEANEAFLVLLAEERGDKYEEDAEKGTESTGHANPETCALASAHSGHYCAAHDSLLHIRTS